VIESDLIANFEWLKVIQSRISSHWKWFINSACVVCCCLASLDAAQGGRWERKTAPTLFIYKICPFRLPLFLFWHPSPSARRNAACLELHRKSQSLDHLPHETLHVRRAANRLCLRRCLRPFMENLTNQDYSPADWCETRQKWLVLIWRETRRKWPVVHWRETRRKWLEVDLTWNKTKVASSWFDVKQDESG